jgi:DNA-damage-inducible protein J
MVMIMAVKTANFNMRMSEQTKLDAENLFSTLGMTLPQAINMFIAKSLLVGGIPFEVRVPRYNRETEAAIQEARDIAAGKVKAKVYSSTDELFKDCEK